MAKQISFKQTEKPTLGYYRTHDPLRQPNWRYERALELVSHQLHPHPERDDAIVRQVYRYIRQKRLLQTQYVLESDLNHVLAEKFNSLWHADRLYSAGNDHRVRFQVEAMILARQTDEEIAPTMGATEEAVDAYEQVFYHVRDRIDQRNYIASVVIGDTFMSGLANKTSEMVAKYFGYFAGPLVLKTILDAFDDDRAMPEEPHDIISFLEHLFRRRIQTSAVVGMTYFDPTNYNIRTLIEGYQMLLSLQYRERAVGGDQNVISQAIDLFSRMSPSPVGTEHSDLPAVPGPVYAQGAIEPRVSELAEMSDGKAPAALLEYNDPAWKSPLERRRDGEADKPQDRR